MSQQATKEAITKQQQQRKYSSHYSFAVPKKLTSSRGLYNIFTTVRNEMPYWLVLGALINFALDAAWTLYFFCEWMMISDNHEQFMWVAIAYTVTIVLIRVFVMWLPELWMILSKRTRDVFLAYDSIEQKNDLVAYNWTTVWLSGFTMFVLWMYYCFDVHVSTSLLHSTISMICFGIEFMLILQGVRAISVFTSRARALMTNMRRNRQLQLQQQHQQQNTYYPQSSPTAPFGKKVQ